MSDEMTPKDALGAAKAALLSVVPASSLLYEGAAMADGARKYGAYNYRGKKAKASVYVDACLRHLLAWYDGEENAADSGLPHLAHAKACLGILIDTKETGNLIDDRPPTGTAAALLERFRKTESVTSPGLDEK